MKRYLWFAAFIFAAYSILSNVQAADIGTGEVPAPYTEQELNAMNLEPSTHPGNVDFQNRSYDWVHLRLKHGNGTANVSIRRGATNSEYAYGASAICMCWLANNPIYHCPANWTVWAPVGKTWVFGVTSGNKCNQSF